MWAELEVASTLVPEGRCCPRSPSGLHRFSKGVTRRPCTSSSEGIPLDAGAVKGEELRNAAEDGPTLVAKVTPESSGYAGRSCASRSTPAPDC